MADEFKAFTPQEMYDHCVNNYFGTGSSKKWGIRHFEVLCKNFNQNENIPIIFIGIFNKVGSNCAFAVAGKKLLIGRKKMIGDYFYSISSNKINNVTLEKADYSHLDKDEQLSSIQSMSNLRFGLLKKIMPKM